MSIKYNSDFLGKNKEWLYENYITNKKTIGDMSQILDCSYSLIWSNLKKYNIPIRNPRENQINNRKGDGFIINQSVLSGCLLGDASLCIGNKHSNFSAPYFRKSNLNKDHIEFVASLLFTGDQYNIKEKKYNGKLNGHTMFSITSLSHDVLIPIFKKWYPESNGFRKVIPEDIEIDESVLLHWFLDDGTCAWNASKAKRSVVQFCTECFNRNEQEMICDKINEKFDLGSHIYKKKNSGTGLRIRIPSDKVMDFFNIIGPSPIESLSYKWKIPEKIDDYFYDADFLYKKYFEEQIPIKEISEILNKKENAVYAAVNRYKNNIWNDKKTKRDKNRGSKQKGKYKYPELHDPEWLYQKHIIEGKTADEIAQILSSTKETVKSMIYRARKNHWSEKTIKRLSKYPDLQNKEWLFDQYVNKGLSFIKISEILNCSPGIVEYYIKFFNINKK